MIFKQFYNSGLGHASYLLGAEDSGEAMVVDVRRDVDDYYRHASAKAMRIRYAADTHQHNDYLTGITTLRARSPLELLAGARAQLGYDATPLADGQRVCFGEVVVEVLETPGHTPEHISFLVHDRSRGEEPLMLLSGGALLVADVARPDLLGDDHQTKAHARRLCRTLKEKILTLPDHVMVFPTHVAGSLCGGNIGSMLFTTIGYERRMNRMLAAIANEDEFERQCLDQGALPTVPPYWPRMRKANIDGPQPLGVLTDPPALPVEAFAQLRDEGAIVLDCRQPEAFGGAHVPGALNVGLIGSFVPWAGTVLPEGAAVLLVLDSPETLWEATTALLRIGYDLPLGWLAGGMLAWRTAGRDVACVPQWSVGDLRDRMAGDASLSVLDVRQMAEWQAGHVPGAQHIPGGELPQRLDAVPRNRALAVYCGSGYRSSVACALLKANGWKDVNNVIGGFQAWTARGLPVED